MLKWSDLKRSRDDILAVWPVFKPLHGRWFMQELVEKGKLPPAWRDRYVQGEGDSVQSEHYPDRTSATASATAFNPQLRTALSARLTDPFQRRSLELKADKGLQSKQRLQDEEALMLAEAIRRHAGDERPDAASLQLALESEPYRQDLADQLAAMPYLWIAQVGWEVGRWRKHMLVYRDSAGVWSKPYNVGEKAAATSERAKIANGFNLSATAH